jgi:hypothetical protein
MVRPATKSSERAAASAAEVTVYLLLWRPRAGQAWRSEEFDNRTQAHQRYFSLIERGAQAFLERRRACRPA